MKKRVLSLLLTVALLMSLLSTGAFAAKARKYGDVPIYFGDVYIDYMANEILKEIDLEGKDDVERIRAVYDWIVLNCERYGTASQMYFDIDKVEKEAEDFYEYMVEALADGDITLRLDVAGDMTTVGKSFLTYDDLLPVYMRQATALRDSGVDLYVIETMMGLEETMAALEACRMVSDLPVMCSFTITSDGQFYLGGNVYDAAPQLEGFGVDAVGINCSCGPDQLESVIRMLHGLVTIPLIAKPNAGMPIIDEKGNAIYNMVADDFGEHMKKLYQAGATVLGGCCGTDPSYIRSLCDHLKTV